MQHQPQVGGPDLDLNAAFLERRAPPGALAAARSSSVEQGWATAAWRQHLSDHLAEVAAADETLLQTALRLAWRWPGRRQHGAAAPAGRAAQAS